ncbi:branched-chain amino acid ABC transporter permease [Paucibacter sp. R3-3]|uniref:Branched-chain amino acid ABC transporter permease n=1 Tax=Roseateles agri TaxID=3098619 RepID=A0ABU5DP12_9BURK|nr:branched-chain amino acid ABC transporter permease [Paucibacter sp. R3-3]MDY0748054.1 branched-chain amino acid ABC transporter permease [Paucibacter sp. R3-3]
MRKARPSRTLLRVLPLLALALPFVVGNEYQLHVLTLIGIYWVLIAGLNLVVGYAGQLSVGHVGLLALGAYTLCILTARAGLDPLWGLALGGALGGLCGLALGLPSLRLPGFYFAMATLAFSMIVTELLVAQNTLTGGGAGMTAPMFNAPFDTPGGFFTLVALCALLVTWLSWNVTRRLWGKGLVALRDSEVAAAAVGIPVFRLKLAAFTFSGVTAGVAGGLFASLQGYITPEAFMFELGMFFFICIVIGGNGSIVGPFFGTVMLTLLPEVAAPLAKMGNLLYGLLLLVAVLLVPRGFGALMARWTERHRGRRQAPPVAPDRARLSRALLDMHNGNDGEARP